MDSNGKVLIPCQYNSIQWINDSHFKVDSSFAPTDRNEMQTVDFYHLILQTKENLRYIAEGSRNRIRND